MTHTDTKSTDRKQWDNCVRMRLTRQQEFSFDIGLKRTIACIRKEWICVCRSEETFLMKATWLCSIFKIQRLRWRHLNTWYLEELLSVGTHRKVWNLGESNGCLHNTQGNYKVSFLSDPVCYRLNYRACLMQKYGNWTVFILHQTVITIDPHKEGCGKIWTTPSGKKDPTNERQSPPVRWW